MLEVRECGTGKGRGGERKGWGGKGKGGGKEVEIKEGREGGGVFKYLSNVKKKVVSRAITVEKSMKNLRLLKFWPLLR